MNEVKNIGQGITLDSEMSERISAYDSLRGDLLQAQLRTKYDMEGINKEKPK